MKNKELFDKTIGILVNAYHKGTLVNGDCHACAVGNLVAANMGINIISKAEEFILLANGVSESLNPGALGWDKESPNWMMPLLVESSGFGFIENQQTNSTGYTVLELKQIEAAFEGRAIALGYIPSLIPNGLSAEERMYNGLMRVYDTLCEIHEVDKATEPTGAEVFTKEKVAELA